MTEINYKIVREIKTISKFTKKSLKLSLVSWNDNHPKYDLRKWSSDGDTPYKGVTLTEKELLNVYNILVSSIKMEKSTTIKYNITLGKANALIYDVLGEYKESKSMPGVVTYLSWGSANKYDIRPWNKDFSKCGKGVSMNEVECQILIRAIENELNLNNNEEFDTSDIEDLLL